MADLYTLKHGFTFYAKFGFTPFNDDPVLISTKKFNKNKEIINNLIVEDSKLLYYLEKFQTKAKYDIDKIINYIKKNQDKLLQF